LHLSDVDAVTKIVGHRNRVAATVASGATVRLGNQSAFATINGVIETTPQVFVRSLARGPYLTRSDVDTQRRVAVLGASVAEHLFAGRDAVGQQITIAGVRFRVVGVFASLGQSLAIDRDD